MLVEHIKSIVSLRHGQYRELSSNMHCIILGDTGAHDSVGGEKMTRRKVKNGGVSALLSILFFSSRHFFRPFRLLLDHTTCSWHSVAEEGPGERGFPLFLDQNEARRAEKNFCETGLPPYLRVWMTAPPPLIWRSGSATGIVWTLITGRWQRVSLNGGFNSSIIINCPNKI